MSNHDRHKPGETANQRKSKRSKKAAQQPGTRPQLEPELTNAARELTDNGVTSVEAAVSEAVSDAASAAAVTSPPIETEVAAREEVVAREVAAKEEVARDLPDAAVSSAEPSPVGLQTIASAYRDYTRKSFAEATSFVEKLASARSLDKAVEAQTEFARQACETFAADSRRIRTLYNELFWQSLRFPMWPPGQAQR